MLRVVRFVKNCLNPGCTFMVDSLLFNFLPPCLTVSSTCSWFSYQVIVSGKLRAQRAKSMKFKDGYMISSGQPVKDYIDSAVRHVLLRQVCFIWSDFAQALTERSFAQKLLVFIVFSNHGLFSINLQGVIGIKVKIMLDWDPKGKQGPTTPLPDIVTIHPPKEEEDYIRPAAFATEIEAPAEIL